MLRGNKFFPPLEPKLPLISSHFLCYRSIYRWKIFRRKLNRHKSLNQFEGKGIIYRAVQGQTNNTKRISVNNLSKVSTQSQQPEWVSFLSSSCFSSPPIETAMIKRCDKLVESE